MSIISKEYTSGGKYDERILDHFICVGKLKENCQIVKILDYIELSDHYPILISIAF